jgi:hypothetical protein
LNWDIVEAMSTVKELMLSPAGIVFEPLVAGVDEVDATGVDVDVDVDVDEDVDDDDEQPAAARAIASDPMASQLSRLKRRPTPLLLPNRMPYTPLA